MGAITSLHLQTLGLREPGGAQGEGAPLVGLITGGAPVYKLDQF